MRAFVLLLLGLSASLAAADHPEFGRPGPGRPGYNGPANRYQIFEIHMRDREFSDRAPGRDVIRLRQEIQRQYGNVNLNRYEIVRVNVDAKAGRFGEMTLVVGGASTQWQPIYGGGYGYNNPGYGYSSYTFDNPSYDSRGVWQLRVRGQVKVDRIVVEAQEAGNGGGGGGYGGWTETVNLDNRSCGRGAGYCSCVTPGFLYSPNAQQADKICRQMGFRGLLDQNSFTTSPTPRGSRICSDVHGGGCFINGHEGNLVCTSVTCVR